MHGPGIPASTYGKALYYPHITIHDVNWLKLALLYWDGIRRIVPPDTYTDDEREVTEAVEAGLVDNTLAEPYVGRAEQRFLRGLIPLLEYGPIETPQSMRQMIAGDLPGEVYGVHVAKMSEHLGQELLKHRIARQQGPWLEMDKKVGLLYMTCLAVEVGEAIGAPVVTDRASCGGCGEYLLFGQVPSASTPADLEASLLRLDISFPTPDDLNGTPMYRIIDFNRAHATERQKFRVAVESIAAGASEIADPNALTDYLAQEARRIQGAIKEHREGLRELNIRSLNSALKISQPALLSAALVGVAASHPAAAGVLGALGLAVSAADWWAERRGKTRQENQSGEWHYLLSVDRAFHF